MGKWRGYVTIGFTDATKLQAALNACFSQQAFNALRVEPGRVFSAAGASRRTISVWNQNRTHVLSDNECKPVHYASTDAYVLNYTGSPDEVRLAGGYQIDVIQQTPQSLLIRAVVGGGELGPATEEVPLYPGETPPAGKDFMDGGVSCDKVLRSINGVATPHFVISTDMGVVVRSHPLLNRVVINVNGEGLTYCADGQAATAVDCLPASQDNCGPAEGSVVLCPGSPDDKGGYTDVSSDTAPGDGNPNIDLNQLYGTCVYLKTPDGWQLQNANPSFNCECSLPLIGGYLGQSVTTRAKPIAADMPYFVRNGDFTQAFLRWQVTSDSASIVVDDALFDGMPHAVVDNGIISQPLIPLTPRMLRLQADYLCTESVILRIVNQRSGVILLNTSYPAVTSQTQILSDFFTTSGTDVVISFQTTGILKIAEVALVPWQ